MARAARRALAQAARVPVAPAAAAALLSAADGSPIWPVADDATLAALTRLAALFDGNLVVTKPIAGQSRAAAGRAGTVLSAAAEADAAAALYAHLTGRRFVAAAHAARASLWRPDVVVAPAHLLAPGFLSSLHGDPDRAPGLIAAATPAALLRQAVLRAAALRLCGGPARDSVDVMPHAPVGETAAEGRHIFGGLAPREALRHALGRGSEILSVFTVGDGLDAVLGPLILCPLAGTPARPAPQEPPCVGSGTCHRLQLPMTEATGSPGLVPPEALAARLLLLHACWGIQPVGSLYGQAWGYGWRLADSDRLGAIVTTWQITIGAPADTEALARLLARGIPLGRAVAQFNHGHRARRTGQLMCLLGDPAFRLAPSPRTAPALRRERGPGRPHPAPSSAGVAGHLAFLAACLEVTDLKPGSEIAQETARRAVAVCQRLAWEGRTIDSPGEVAGATMRTAMLDFLCAHGTIPAYHWMRLGHPVRAASSGCCLACGQPDSEVVLRLRVPGVASRRLTLGPRCGLTEDRPVGVARLGLAVAGPLVRLHRPAASGHAAAVLLLRPHAAPATARRWDLFAQKEGAPAMAVFEANGLREAGQLLLFAIEGAALHVGRTPYGPGLSS